MTILLSKEEQGYAGVIRDVMAPVPTRCPLHFGRITVVAVGYTPFGLVAVQPALANAGQWGLPQGGVNPGESPAYAALRELHEELSIRPGVVKIEEAQLLGFYLSTQARGGRKLLVGVGVSIPHLERVRLGTENRGVRLVRSKRALSDLTRGASAGKREAIEHFVDRSPLGTMSTWGVRPRRGESPFS
jgi:8-oxo-dGTP pyrophosphatase MutT (NUDIX family)